MPTVSPHDRVTEERRAEDSGATVIGAFRAGPFRVSHKRYAPGFRQGMHAHAEGTVDFNMEGGGEGVYGREALESRAGALEYFAPAREHSFRAGPKGIRTMHVVFGPEVLESCGAVPDGLSGRHIDQAAAVGIAVRLMREVSDPDASTSESAESLAYELLAAAGRWRDKPERGARWLVWVRERLHHAPLTTLDELSRLAGVHRSHLARAFVAQYGVSVGEYARRVRLTSAAAGLASPGASPVRVAQEHGFADQAHLTRWFARVLGVTPGAYQRALRDRSPRG